MKNPKEILLLASSDMQDALELGGQAGKDRYWKVVDSALAQLEEYYRPKLSIQCDFCDKELTEFGANLYGAPDKDMMCKKTHLCKECYNLIINNEK